MKKTLIFIIILSSILLTWCLNNDISSSKSGSWDNIIDNTWIDNNTFNKATINNNENNEATEEIDTTINWGSATVTSFWSWENNSSWEIK